MDPFRDHIRHSSYSKPVEGTSFVFSSRRTCCPKCNSSRSFSEILGHSGKGKCFRCDVFLPPDLTDSVNARPAVRTSTPPHEQIYVNWDVVQQTMQYFDLIDLEFHYDRYAREERAAILEHLAGFTREEAERMTSMSVGEHDEDFHATLRKLHQRFPFAARLAEITRSVSVLSDCLIGQSEDGAAIYWYRDVEGRVVNGKKIYYEGFSRDKDQRLPHFVYSTSHGYGLCLFGEEQLSADHLKSDLMTYTKATPIFLVESEKTALIGRYLIPHVIWIATGGAQSLTRARAKVLEGRTVKILFDQDAAGGEGALKAQRLLDSMGITCYIIDPPQLLGMRMSGFDLADHFDRTTPSIL